MMVTGHVPQSGKHGRSGITPERILLVILIVLLIIVAGLLFWLIRDVTFSPAEPTAVPPGVAPGTAVTAPQMKIAPDTGVQGTMISVWGQGWLPDDELIICLDDLGDPAEPPVYAEIVANHSGQFYATFAFPDDVQWQSLPDIPVVVESKTSHEKRSAIFKLAASTAVLPTYTAVLPTAVLPTATLPPTAVPPTPTPACFYNMRFVTDVTISDDTVIPPGVSFIKTWRIQNNGTCAWPAGTSWVFAGGSQMNGPNAVLVPSAQPGETVDVSVQLTAPTAPGGYTGYWTLRLPEGTMLSQRVYVRIVVSPPTATPTAILPTRTTNPPTATATAIPTVTYTPTAYPPTPTPVINNWRGEYYSNPLLTGVPTMIRDDTAVNFNWGTGAPASGMPADNFSVRWNRIYWLTQGNYRFSAAMDDGLRLYVDNVLLINEWRDGSYREVSAEQWLAAGNHQIYVEYYEHLGDAQARVWWEPVAGYPDWRGEYWSNKDLAGSPVLTRNDPTIDFNWQFAAPASGLPDEEFSARWTREINFEAGTYRLSVRADDGVRVFVDGQKVIDEWHLNDGKRTYQVEMTLQGKHTLVVEYYENLIAAEVHFRYERLSN